MDRYSMLFLAGLAGACIPAAPEGTDTPPPPPLPTTTVRDAGPSTPMVERDGGTAAKPDAGFVDAGTAPHDAGTRDGGPPPPTGLPILGNGLHTLDAVVPSVVADPSVGHDRPTDLAFNPTRTDELWVVNQGDNTVWIATSPGEPNESAVWRGGRTIGRHFLPRPSGIAFGDSGDFATIHEEDRITQSTTPADFMGPTLWPSNLSIFDGGHGGHIDMLHNTPNGMGIAWESGNAYWVFDGYHASLTRYDFRRDHGPGGSDHSDGQIIRYVEGQVSRVDGVPSHLFFDASSRTLYVADTGNNRIATLDIDTGNRGRNISPNYDGITQYEMTGATLETFIDGASSGLTAPSGLEIHDGHVFVGDNATGIISGFTMEGELVDWLDTMLPAGALTGLAFDSRGRLYYLDAVGGRVLRVAEP